MTDTRKAGILIALAIVALTLAAYSSAIARGGFIWDDELLLTNNPLIAAPDGLQRFWFTTQPIDYWPVTWTTLWLEWRLWGATPAGYHVTNVLLHALSAVLVWRLLKALRVPGAAVAAAVFAAHPVCVASVAWISERKNTLSMVFYLLSLLAYVRFQGPAGRRRLWYALAMLALLVGLLSKASVIMAPVVMLGIAWWMRGRIGRKDLLAAAPMFALAVVFAGVTIWFQQQHAVGSVPTRPEGFLSRLAAAGMVPWFYLYKDLLPVKLTMIYPRWQVDPGYLPSYLPGVALLGCLVVFWICRRGWGRWPLAAMGYFVVTLFPVLGFFEMAFAEKSLVADHLQYISMIGPISLVVAVGWWASGRLAGKAGGVARVVGAGAVLAMLSVLTFNQCLVLASNDTMWADVLKKNPLSPEAHYELAMRLTDREKLQEAIDEYLEAIELRGNYDEAHNNLGDLYGRQGKLAKAGYHFALALQYRPDNHNARFNLAVTQWRIGAIPEAVGNLREFLAANPDHAPAMNVLARILSSDGDDAIRNGPQAVMLARRSCELTGPGDTVLADRLDTLAMAYAETGQFDLAVKTGQIALELAREQTDQRLEGELVSRIELYQQGKPYRVYTPRPGSVASSQSSQPAAAGTTEPSHQ